MASVFTIIFIVALAAVANGLAEEKEAKPKENAKLAAVNKVTTLMTDLITMTKEEGLKEAKTYAKFCSFCDSNTKAKSATIQTESDGVGTLSSEIDSFKATKLTVEGAMETLQGVISGKEADIVKFKKERKAEMETYAVNAADLTNAMRGISEALKALNANKQLRSTGSFMQLPRDLKESIERLALTADALGLASAAAVTSLVQQTKPEEYGFHAGDIVSSLNGLKTEFDTQKGTLDKAEAVNKKTFEGKVSGAEAVIKSKTEELSGKETERGQAISAMAVSTSDMEITQKQLDDDQAYLKELSRSCEDKKTTYDQRTKLRMGEIEALTTAVAIVKGTVAEKTSAATVRLISTKFSARQAHFAMHSEQAMADAEEEAEAAESDAGTALIQQRSRSSPLAVHMATRELQEELDHPERNSQVEVHDAAEEVDASVQWGIGAKDPRKEAVMTLLRTKAKTLNSESLSSLARDMAVDPLAEVKRLLQGLVEKLLQKTSDETNQRGWCEKSVSDAKTKRDHNAKALASLNAEMAGLESRMDKLTVKLATLGEEQKSLKKAQTEADGTRRDETSQSGKTISEAKEGLSAVQEAISTLEKFYKAAAKAAVTIKGGKKSKQEMDAGFESGEAYQGNQGGATGIVGMLQVIEGDFKRTMTQTKEAEARAEQDHLKFTTMTQSSLAEKEVSVTQTNKAKNESSERLTTAKAGMKMKTGLLTNAIGELQQLKPACGDAMMSQEERAAKRQEEVDALKSALKLFESEQ